MPHAFLVGRFLDRAFRLSLNGKRCRMRRRRGGACAFAAFLVGCFHDRAFRLSLTGKRCRTRRRRGGACCALAAFLVRRFHGRARRIGTISPASIGGPEQKSAHIDINLARSASRSDRAYDLADLLPTTCASVASHTSKEKRAHSLI